VLTFSEKGHRYRLDGRDVPGVTTLLKGLPKPALVYWSARTVAEYAAANVDQIQDMLARGGERPTVDFLKGVPWQRRDDAALRGTDIHGLAEQLAHGQAVEVPDPYRHHVTGYAHWLDTWQPTVVLTERPVANRRWWYAGKPDLVADMAGDRWLLDVKTAASGVYGEAALQLAAYANAEFYVPGDDPADEQPMPECGRLGVLWVTDAGTVLREVVNPAQAFKDFLHVAFVARAKDRIDNYLSDALDAPGAEAIA
jgi:hypothetical protein